MARVKLSAQDIDDLSRVVQTEVDHSLKKKDPAEYARQVNGVVDTILNRLSTGRYGKTLREVVNQRNQFSQISGNANAYGSVQAAPKADLTISTLVKAHVADRVHGAPSSVGGDLNYLNPVASAPGPLRKWGNAVVEQGIKFGHVFGFGKRRHYHGTAPGIEPAGSYSVAADGINTGPGKIGDQAPLSELLDPLGHVRSGSVTDQGDFPAPPIDPIAAAYRQAGEAMRAGGIQNVGDATPADTGWGFDALAAAAQPQQGPPMPVAPQQGPPMPPAGPPLAQPPVRQNAPLLDENDPRYGAPDAPDPARFGASPIASGGILGAGAATPGMGLAQNALPPSHPLAAGILGYGSAYTPGMANAASDLFDAGNFRDAKNMAPVDDGLDPDVAAAAKEQGLPLDSPAVKSMSDLKKREKAGTINQPQAPVPMPGEPAVAAAAVKPQQGPPAPAAATPAGAALPALPAPRTIGDSPIMTKITTVEPGTLHAADQPAEPDTGPATTSSTAEPKTGTAKTAKTAQRGIFATPDPVTRNYGSGATAMDDILTGKGKAGDTAYSRSMPGYSVRDLGNGWVETTNQYGAKSRKFVGQKGGGIFNGGLFGGGQQTTPTPFAGGLFAQMGDDLKRFFGTSAFPKAPAVKPSSANILKTGSGGLY